MAGPALGLRALAMDRVLSGREKEWRRDPPGSGSGAWVRKREAQDVTGRDRTNVQVIYSDASA